MKSQIKKFVTLFACLCLLVSAMAIGAFAGTPAEDIAAAMLLEHNQSLDYDSTMTGEITAINTAYSSQYKNITVTIDVDGTELKCFRLTADESKLADVEALAVGDTITVTGKLAKYYENVQFGAGTKMTAVVKATTEIEIPEDPKEIVDAAFALASGKSLPYEASLVATVTEVTGAYDPSYGTLTVNATMEGTDGLKTVQLKYLPAADADQVVVGTVIGVTGTFQNYNGTVQMYKPKLDYVALTDYKEIVDAAYALESGKELPYKTTIKGEITKIDTPYSSQYENISVVIAVEGADPEKPILVFRVKGEGAADLAVGDVITTTGIMKNYNGLIELTGCTLDAVVKGENEAPKAPEDPKEIVDAAFELAPGSSLLYEATLTGKITAIETPYDDGYKNVSVIISVEGTTGAKDLLVYRLKGEGADTIKVGDTITVTGSIINYNGTVEFGSGCVLTNVVIATPDDEDDKDNEDDKDPEEDKDPDTDVDDDTNNGSDADDDEGADNDGDEIEIPTTGEATDYVLPMLALILAAAALVVGKKVRA